MAQIIQSVPNFSEGRDQDKIEEIVSVFKDKEGFTLANYESDKDHNRTVVTLVGEPQAIKEAIIEMVGKTTKLIDLTKHNGEHPRMGATDVIPYIPISNIKMEECIELAKETAQRISELYDIPTFLYAEATDNKNHVKLPNIRKGEFEGMNEKIKDDKWKPDFGKQEIHPTAGVTAVGARVPLIAFNINLATNDLKIAKEISKAIRFSSGGFRHIQAGPMELKERDIVQVSMNILDYRKTSIYRVFETVKMEAKRYGVNVIGSEVIGLVPMEALAQSIEYYLKIEDFNMEKILETHILNK